MVKTSQLATPTERPIGTAPSAPMPPSFARSARALAAELAGASLLALLLTFNAWWCWRDARPPADLQTVDAWIQKASYSRAEAALREHVRRFPYDGEHK